jgi:two-component system, LytTR family, sensor kinase
MLQKISTYWWCQIIGWSVNIAIGVFFVSTFGQPDERYYESLVLSCILGLLLTHFMRFCIFYFKVLAMPVKKQVLSFIGLTITFAVLYGFLSEAIDYFIGYNPERLQQIGRPKRLLLGSINAFWIILIWNLIYYVYHYVESNRRQKMDTFRLEALVKSLELKTIKSHINPHFIFNSLNSIRALIDENPARARAAVTELSNILRSSMQAEKMETVPLKQELDIVNDYLALEQMRFEERLKIELDIDKDTLAQPIPPMMLQTLVENAIKHGISKQIDGGLIRIVSDFKKDHHELLVQNSGKLNGDLQHSDGFGIKSTQDRLNLLYQGKAYFEIYDNTENNMVECRIVMPVASIL